jgi:hypothetical protein
MHRFGQRDDRRRRLLADDLSNNGGGTACRVWSADGPPQQKSEHYGEAEFLDRQPRLLDLVPRGKIGLFLLFVAAGVVVAGLEAAYAWMLNRVAAGGACPAVLDLAAKGSLGCWIASLWLLASSAAAFLVYSIRRHRTDDYQGRYRIWLWAAACWFILAADQAASLSDGFCDLMIALTGTPLWGDGTLWWAIPYALILGAVGSRLLMDIRSSRLAFCAMLTAIIVLLLVMAGRLGWIPFDGAARKVMVLAGADMIGGLLLLTAITLYARHEIFDAEGLLPRREKQSDKESDEENEEEESSPVVVKPPSSAAAQSLKIDTPHVSTTPAYRQSAAPVVSASTAKAATPSPVTPASAHHKQTKAERKALKERLLHERLERQGRLEY